MSTKWTAGVGIVPKLALAQARLLRRPAVQADAVIVGYPGHFDLRAARRAARGRPVVFNPLVSLVDTMVSDRGRFRPGSLPARVLATIDRRALRAADLVVTTPRPTQTSWPSSRAPEQRFAVCFVGAEEDVFKPGWAPEEPATAVFVGKLIPPTASRRFSAPRALPRSSASG